MNILPLKGYKSIRALNGFNALLLGLKMLPAYIMEPYEIFYANFKDKTDEQKEKLLKEAVLFVQLTQDEVEAIISFATDANGISYQPANIKNLAVEKLHEIIVAVGMEFSKIKIDLISEDEKKKYRATQSTSELSS